MWAFANGHTSCMIGSHSDIMISDLIMKHENDFCLNLTQIIEAI